MFWKQNSWLLLVLMLSFLKAGIAENKTFQGNLPAGRDKFLYQAACSACHGPAGTGVPREQAGFETPLPDFSDCRFAQREPDSDWLAVIHKGGPARAFNRIMPAFGMALSAEEIQQTLNYVRSFCTNKKWPRGELNLPRALVTEKAFPEDEAVLTTSFATNRSGSVLNKFVYEQRFGALNQIELIVPFDAKEGDPDGWNAGLGDIAVGFKRVLYHNNEKGRILSFVGEAIFPTGDDEKDLGKGTTVIEPFIAFGQAFPADAFIQFQGGFEFPVDRDVAANEAFWRFAVGQSFTHRRFGRSFSPMIELLGVQELEEGSRAHWDLVPQIQISLSRRQHILFNGGVRFPINDTESRSTQIIVYLLWDWFDGGFFDGW